MATASTAATASQSATPDGPDSVGPSPYGTRSRNRTGNARPNYAEDRDTDADFELSSTRRAHASASAAPSTRAAEAEKAAAQAARKPGPPVPPREHIPGTSSFSVADSGPGSRSKKRKSPGASTTVAHGNSPAAAPAVSTRKSSQLAPASSAASHTNVVSFENTSACLVHGCLVADDKTKFAPNGTCPVCLSVNVGALMIFSSPCAHKPPDFIYLVCEPPGEPYYVGRLMEFIHKGNDPTAPVEQIRCNWVYRPRDIGRKATDTRLLFASMHSESSPITSLRGKCNVQHRHNIDGLEKYRKKKDSFYYNQMYDRYIHRYYDVVPTSQVINVPEAVKKVLDERWEFVIVESGRAKELTSAIKTCKRCAGYCAKYVTPQFLPLQTLLMISSHDSVDCAMCKNTYHMNCVQPPLQKKPARGFAWSCGPCSRKQERKLEARNVPTLASQLHEGEEDEYMDEEEEDPGARTQATSRGSPASGEGDTKARAATKAQVAEARMWPFRYLGIHCKVEDALDYDDRIYPRASSRLGPRHQANVLSWHGRPFEYVKPAEIKRKYVKNNSHKKDGKLTRETLAAIEADKVAKDKRPKWIVDEPPGYARRGEDCPNDNPANTAKALFKLPEVGEKSTRGGDSLASLDPEEREKVIDKYMRRAKEMAPSLGVPDHHTNFLDRAIELLYSNKFNPDAALKQLRLLDLRKDLKEPKLSKEDLRKFEEGVAKYGSNLGDVSRHVGKTQKHGDVVRFYYLWKRTEKGRQIWGSYEGRKNKKPTKLSDQGLLDDVADDFDDSAFDNEKATRRKRGFECKFCYARQSRFWRRAPGIAPGATVPAEPGSKSKDKGNHLMVALCQRCANLWRKYAIQWESVDEVAKKIAQTGGRAFKRKLDEDLFIELVNANAECMVGINIPTVATAQALGVEVNPALVIQPEQENPRKKVKTAPEKEAAPPPAPPPEPPKKKVEKPPEPPLVPEQPRFKTLPCAVCDKTQPLDEHFCCRHCRLSVHQNCYGIPERRAANKQKWLCDMCQNDSTNKYSTKYECVLCPNAYNELELTEPLKTSHKKKTDREREKERIEKELVLEFTANYERRQEELGRPTGPHEPLKPTANGNWMHVVCSVFTPWIQFRDAAHLDKAEGTLSVPRAKFDDVCGLCKMQMGVTVTCHWCPAAFHVTCAQKKGYPLGFDVTPVKGSRRDVISSVAFGRESGNVEAVIYCDACAKNASPNLHPMDEELQKAAGRALNALQVYARNFKQADTSLTGTSRKAAIISSARPSLQSVVTLNPRLTNGTSNAAASSASASATRRASPAAFTVRCEELNDDGDRVVHLESSNVVEASSKQCGRCRITTSPRWYKDSSLVNGQHRGPADVVMGGTDAADKPRYLCHRCHMKKQQEPPPPRPEPAIPIQRELSREPPHLAPQPSASPAWQPAPAPNGPPPHSDQWVPSRPALTAAPPVVANGLSYGPPPPATGPHPLPPHPQSPYSSQPPPLYRPNAYDAPPPHSVPPPMPHPQASAPQPPPPLAYAARPPPPPVDPLGYTPRGAPPPPHHHGSPGFATRPINGAPHSPPPPPTAYGGRPIGQGPSGPPRAADNPFFQPQRSPRPQQPQQQHYGPGPLLPHERPMTGEAMGGGRGPWDRDRELDREREREREREARERERERGARTTNGASASPSLRHLMN